MTDASSNERKDHLLEVIPSERGGRGHYWGPNHSGYTDDPAHAGLYTEQDARRQAETGHSSQAVFAVPILLQRLGEGSKELRELEASMDSLSSKIDELCSLTGDQR